MLQTPMNTQVELNELKLCQCMYIIIVLMKSKVLFPIYINKIICFLGDIDRREKDFNIKMTFFIIYELINETFYSFLLKWDHLYAIFWCIIT